MLESKPVIAFEVILNCDSFVLGDLEFDVRQCDYEESHVASTIKEAIFWLEEQGWTRKRSSWRCPVCTRYGKKFGKPNKPM